MRMKLISLKIKSLAWYLRRVHHSCSMFKKKYARLKYQQDIICISSKNNITSRPIRSDWSHSTNTRPYPRNFPRLTQILFEILFKNLSKNSFDQHVPVRPGPYPCGPARTRLWGGRGGRGAPPGLRLLPETF